jgi:hypothetical protein
MLRRRKESDFFCPNVGRISFCVHYTMLIAMISMQQSYQNIRISECQNIISEYQDLPNQRGPNQQCPVGVHMSSRASHAQTRPVTPSHAQSRVGLLPGWVNPPPSISYSI